MFHCEKFGLRGEYVFGCDMEKTAGRIFPASFDTQSIQKRLQAELLNEKNGGRLHDATAAYPHTAIYETNKSQNVRPALHATHRAEHFGLFY